MLIVNLVLYILGFVLIWFGSGLIVSSTTNFTKKLRLSPFAFSFVFLGLLTSTPEFSVGLQAVAGHDAEIFVGNLLGGIPVLFLVVIPVLASLGNGISLKHELDNKSLLLTMGVILAPSVLLLDRRITNGEGAVLILLYLLLVFLVERKQGVFDKEHTKLLDFKAYSYKDVFKILLGVALVFVSSNIIVDQTMYFASLFSISAFYISLIAISMGTNLPELSLAIRSVRGGKKDVAMGDYMGSAAANTLLFGIFTLLHRGEVLTINNYIVTFLFILTSLVLFYVFSKSKQEISRKEGLVMLSIYILFVILELWR